MEQLKGFRLRLEIDNKQFFHLTNALLEDEFGMECKPEEKEVLTSMGNWVDCKQVRLSVFHMWI